MRLSLEDLKGIIGGAAAVGKTVNAGGGTGGSKGHTRRDKKDKIKKGGVVSLR